MALHIADTEVSNLAAELARFDNLSKTETLRRLLRRELESRKLREHRNTFAALATEIAADARSQKIDPVTKEEIDDLWGL